MRTAFSAAAFALLAAAGAGLGQAGLTADEPIKDRAGFIPGRKHEPLKGTAVGILLYDGQPVLSAEGPRARPTSSASRRTAVATAGSMSPSPGAP